jgi:hypothetical protein
MFGLGAGVQRTGVSKPESWTSGLAGLSIGDASNSLAALQNQASTCQKESYSIVQYGIQYGTVYTA